MSSGATLCLFSFLQLQILVYRQSNRIGSRPPLTVLVSRLTKSLIILRLRVYSNLVEGLVDIKLYKDLSSTYQAKVLLSRGSGQQSLQVILFSLQQLIQKQSPLFSFLIKRIGMVKGAQLGLIKPLPRLLIRYYFRAYNLVIDYLQRGLKLRVFSLPCLISILQSYSR